MKENQFTLDIQPLGVEIAAYEGDSLYTVLLVNKLLPEGGDAVRLERGVVTAALDPAHEAECFSQAQLADGWMLASERRISGDAEFFISDTPEPFDAPNPEQLSVAAKPQGLGLAIDLGSGLIVGGVAELSGMTIASYSGVDNSQCQLLGDLGPRIRADQDNLAQTQALLWTDIASLVQRLSSKSGFDAEQISTMLMTSNTLLEKVLWAADAESGAQANWSECKEKQIADTPLAELLPPETKLIMLPSIASGLGSDLVAGILASNLDQRVDEEGLTLLLDLGLNSEIVIAGRGRLLAASVSTAPLEGVGLSSGMRAKTGAIVRVRLEDDVWLTTVRDAKPAGICGAGLISAAHTLLEEGLLTEDGRILLPEEPSPELAAHFTNVVGGVEFVLSARKDQQDIAVDQNDIRQLQMAKASVYAACMAVLAELEAEPADIEQILIAESYLNNIDPAAVLGLGFIPPIGLERVQSLGNVSWQGAYLCLGNRALLEHAQQIAQLAEALDLATNLVYAEEFLGAMNFPEPAEDEDWV